MQYRLHTQKVLRLLRTNSSYPCRSIMTKFTSEKPLKIGMFGAGTVGGGVYEILRNRNDVVVSKICAKSLKPRDFCQDMSVFTTDPSDILKDESIDCVVEVMGGVGLAKQVVVDSLRAGKSVVTANKALVAECLDELHQICTESNSILSFEAAVCGGINIIHTLASHYQLDTISSIQGIANGTTNYMLTCMEQGEEYDTVLKRAQELGYAEADPTADVEGHDVRAKLVILTKLGFGVTVTIDQIPTVGISGVSADDFKNAKTLGCTIKLIGTAEVSDDSSRLIAYVSPRMVPIGSALGACCGSGNLVSVESKNNQGCTFSGPGAGRYPTAQSVVADVLKVSSGAANADPFPTSPRNLDVSDDYSAKFYIRGDDTEAVEKLARDLGMTLESKSTFCTSQGVLRRSQLETLRNKCPGIFFMPVDV